MPLAKILSVFLSVKENEKPMYNVRTQRSCPSCGTVAPTLRTKSWKSITFVGIPLYTWKRFVTETCSSCKKTIQKKPATFIQSALWLFS